MQTLVMLFTDEDGFEVPKEDRRWCYACNDGPAAHAYCSGQVFGMGESAVIFEIKSAERGITCPKCREMIKRIKEVKL